MHGLGVDPADDTLYIAVHYGLFRVTDNVPTRVADRWQDTMAFTVTGPGRFLASGHPDLSEYLPSRLGLIESTDAEESWRSLLLLGEADFHSLAVVGRRIFGVDASSGRLLTTLDRASWTTISTGAHVDVAAHRAWRDRVWVATETGEVFEVHLDGTAGLLVGAPRLIVIDFTPERALVGATATGDVYTLGNASSAWQRDGHVSSAPTALDSPGESWYLATEDNVYVSADQGATWTRFLGEPG